MTTPPDAPSPAPKPPPTWRRVIWLLLAGFILLPGLCFATVSNFYFYTLLYGFILLGASIICALLGLDALQSRIQHSRKSRKP